VATAAAPHAPRRRDVAQQPEQEEREEQLPADPDRRVEQRRALPDAAASDAGNRRNHWPFGIFTPNAKSARRTGRRRRRAPSRKYSVEKMENS
jgi:hypothetical protein